MHKRVYGGKARTSGRPAFAIRITTEQQLGENHAPYFRTSPDDVRERFDERSSHDRSAIWCIYSGVGVGKAIIDPANNVVVTDVADE